MAKMKKVLIKEVELRKLRQEAGLTQKQLAEKSGLAISQLCQYENGLWIMEEATYDRIVKVLNN